MDLRESTKRQRKARKQTAVQNDPVNRVRTNTLYRSDRSNSLLTGNLHFAAEENLVNTVKLLLQNGASVDATVEVSMTPLHTAIRSGATDVIKILLKNGANPNLSSSQVGQVHHLNRTYEGDVDQDSRSRLYSLGSPLHMAVSCSVEQDKAAANIVSLLLRYGADVDNNYSPYSRTPLYYAVRNRLSDTVRVLLNYGAQIRLADVIELYESYLNVFGRSENSLRSSKHLKTIFEVMRQIESGTLLETLLFSEESHFFKAFFHSHRTDKRFEKIKRVLSVEYGFSARKFRQECLEELTKMKTVRISNHHTLYDLFSDENKFLRFHFTSNINFQRIIKFNDFSEKFPIYAYLIIWILQKILKLNMRYETCKKSLEIMKKNKLITDKILRCLNPTDWENLSKKQ